jgi:hypothetical protein
MARELNRELFGERFQTSTEAPQTAAASTAPAGDVRQLTLYCEALGKRMKDFESRVETMQTKVEDMVKQNKMRFERIQSHSQNQTEMVKNGFSEINSKIAHVVSRVNERKVSEGMIKELVDRHSQVVQGFEMRLQQLQRVISEQELLLMNSRTELREALQELSRLKKI